MRFILLKACPQVGIILEVKYSLCSPENLYLFSLNDIPLFLVTLFSMMMENTWLLAALKLGLP
jgi:hypothetical protein